MSALFYVLVPQKVQGTGLQLGIGAGQEEGTVSLVSGCGRSGGGLLCSIRRARRG